MQFYIPHGYFSIPTDSLLQFCSTELDGIDLNEEEIREVTFTESHTMFKASLNLSINIFLFSYHGNSMRWTLLFTFFGGKENKIQGGGVSYKVKLPKSEVGTEIYIQLQHLRTFP